MSEHRYEAYWMTGWGSTEPDEPDSSVFLFGGDDLKYVLHFAPAFGVAAKIVHGAGVLVVLDAVAGRAECRNVVVGFVNLDQAGPRVVADKHALTAS